MNTSPPDLFPDTAPPTDPPVNILVAAWPAKRGES
jgi:hypothetical protein